MAVYGSENGRIWLHVLSINNGSAETIMADYITEDLYRKLAKKADHIVRWKNGKLRPFYTGRPGWVLEWGF